MKKNNHEEQEQINLGNIKILSYLHISVQST